MSPLAIMEGCTWGMGAAVAFSIIVPSGRLGALVGFLLLLAIWLIAAREERRDR